MTDLDRVADKQRLEKISRVLNEIEAIIENHKMKMLSSEWNEAGTKAIEEFPTEEIIKEIEETLENEL